jgi:CheY-like chemotaxis protein
MSGYPTVQTIAEALATGAQRFIPKPFLPEELLQVITSVTGGGR